MVSDYRGIPVLSAYERVEFEGVPFAVIAEIDETEVLAPVHETRNILIVAGALILTLILAGGIVFARSITNLCGT